MAVQSRSCHCDIAKPCRVVSHTHHTTRDCGREDGGPPVEGESEPGWSDGCELRTPASPTRLSSPDRTGMDVNAQSGCQASGICLIRSDPISIRIICDCENTMYDPRRSESSIDSRQCAWARRPSILPLAQPASACPLVAPLCLDCAEQLLTESTVGTVACTRREGAGCSIDYAVRPIRGPYWRFKHRCAARANESPPVLPPATHSSLPCNLTVSFQSCEFEPASCPALLRSCRPCLL